MSNSTSIPNSAVIAFNSDYESAKNKISPSSSELKPDRNLEEILRDMANEIHKISYYLVDGSYKKEVIYDRLTQVFKSNAKMELDNGAGVYLRVLPPSDTENVLDKKNESIFRFGHLTIEIEGNPILKTEKVEEPVRDRSKKLFRKMNRNS